jgi:hypothetical protein
VPEAAGGTTLSNVIDRIAREATFDTASVASINGRATYKSAYNIVEVFIFVAAGEFLKVKGDNVCICYRRDER